MNKAHIRRHWKNYPDDSTPLDEVNLNEGDRALDIIDDRVIELDVTKATKIEVSTMISDVSFDDATGIFTFTRKNGAVITLNTKLEKLAVNFTYDAQNERLVITLDDGTVQYVDMSALITQYEFVDSDTIAFTLGSDGKVTADIKNGSVTEDKLQPNYLADIKVEVGKAQTASSNAEASAQAAALSESTVEAYKSAAQNAQADAETAQAKAEQAQTGAVEARKSAESAKTDAETAQAKAESAKTGAETAEINAQGYANNATNSAAAAGTSEQNAQTYADKSQSYAVGTNGEVRENDVTDNAKNYYEQAKYYYEQAKSISETLSGILQPKGTITFAELPGLLDAEDGWMYNISDAFTTDARFKEGAGVPVAAGSNVYKTVDNQWDILAGSPVTRVAGKTGDVALDKNDVGLGNADNTADADKSVKYAQTAGSATDPTKLPLSGGTIAGDLKIGGNLSLDGFFEKLTTIKNRLKVFAKGTSSSPRLDVQADRVDILKTDAADSETGKGSSVVKITPEEIDTNAILNTKNGIITKTIEPHTNSGDGGKRLFIGYKATDENGDETGNYFGIDMNSNKKGNRFHFGELGSVLVPDNSTMIYGVTLDSRNNIFLNAKKTVISDETYLANGRYKFNAQGVDLEGGYFAVRTGGQAILATSEQTKLRRANSGRNGDNTLSYIDIRDDATHYSAKKHVFYDENENVILTIGSDGIEANVIRGLNDNVVYSYNPTVSTTGDYNVARTYIYSPVGTQFSSGAYYNTAEAFLANGKLTINIAYYVAVALSKGSYINKQFYMPLGALANILNNMLLSAVTYQQIMDSDANIIFKVISAFRGYLSAPGVAALVVPSVSEDDPVVHTLHISVANRYMYFYDQAYCVEADEENNNYPGFSLSTTLEIDISDLLGRLHRGGYL